MMLNKMKFFFKKHSVLFIGILLGAIGGILYWKLIGCSSGTCPITSSPINSSIWGAVMGGLIASSFTPEKIKKKKEESHE